MTSSMLLISSTWDNKKTIKLIPVTKECPFNEGIYDPAAKVLVLISKEKKESFHMMPRLNQFGDLERLKIGKRDNGKDYAEERKVVSTFYEYYIENMDEIKDFIAKVAINLGSFDLTQYLVEEPVVPKGNIITS